MSEEYLRELRRWEATNPGLAERLERQQKGLTSQYTDEEKLDPNDFKNIVNARLKYSPIQGQKWQEYATKLNIYTDLAAEKNRLTHIDGPRKAWWTHRNPMGCFMCEDINLISCMLKVIKIMASQHPDNIF